VSEGAQSDVDAAIAAARRAFDGGKWPTFSASRRGKVLFKMAQLIAERTDELARLEVRDNGKTIATAKGEIGAIVEVFEFYGGAATKNYGDTIPGMSSSFSISTTRESAGVVGAIIPWISRRSWPHGKCAGTCDGLHDRSQAGAVDAAYGAQTRRDRAGSRFASGRFQRRDGLDARTGGGDRRASRRR